MNVVLSIMLSTAPPEQCAEAALERGATAFIQKPFSPRAIAQKVREILDGTSS